MIEFYDNDMSVCAQKVRLVLAAKGLEYQRHVMNLRTGDQFRPDYLKLNPKAVVPTLPYVLRLEHLGLEDFWRDLPQVGDWLERSKARSEYAAIDRHIDPAYVDLMRLTPDEQRETARRMAAA